MKLTANTNPRISPALLSFQAPVTTLVPKEATAIARTATVAISTQKGNHPIPTSKDSVRKNIRVVARFPLPLDKYMMGSRTARITETLRITCAASREMSVKSANHVGMDSRLCMINHYPTSH